ncbi:MAG: DUF2752 domain-containing protein [Balneolaceae bacterium]
MDPATTGTSFCLFDLAGVSFCPGEGLGHSVAYTFRGDLSSAFQAHLAGPVAVFILTFRILHIWKKLITNKRTHSDGKINRSFTGN